MLCTRGAPVARCRDARKGSPSPRRTRAPREPNARPGKRVQVIKRVEDSLGQPGTDGWGERAGRNPSIRLAWREQ